MFNIVPSNRQEHLLIVISELIKQQHTQSASSIFTPVHVMVESLGMKHFVNMGIARHLGVSMNIEFPLVSRGIYNICRLILGENEVPKESLYKREILVWRIESILRASDFINNQNAEAANTYWQNASDPSRARFMLAQNTADVFEQYMQYRPNWFESWEKGESVIKQNTSIADILEPWQRLLWQMLIKDKAATLGNGNYPAKILQSAIEKFEVGKVELPQVLHIFVVNALSRQQLELLYKISQQIDIFFYHLNPCGEYWADLVTDKQRMHLCLKAGIDNFLNEDSPNSLLANLGTQGRVLFKQLQQIDYPDFTDKALFQDLLKQSGKAPATLLEAVQQDLLKASTGSIQNVKEDNSVSIHSCHSHLREIQVLHDQLLHIIQANKDATDEHGNSAAIHPHDIIVLCPAVEEYAPYVKSVFRDLFDKEQPGNPRLVCSIADRAPLDANPLISMFMDMLALPDSRFSVSSLIDYLHIESVQQQFDLSLEDVELCEAWIAQANIFWGKDATHKAKVIQAEKSNNLYTWEWGLSRLLKSALFADSAENDVPFAMLHCVEGQGLNVLAKLMLFIDSLQGIHAGLIGEKTMSDWLSFMQLHILEVLFSGNANNNAVSAIKRALNQVSMNTANARFDDKVSLSVAREALSAVLSIPDPLNQFNTGQVTFCSMVPMRSVPFKVICVLGLNDGVFPRTTQALSVDLMTQDKPLETDRSRRNEDRYMFLEAIISARQYLYLSYQGNSLKNNSEREPSLVLREFIDYLTLAFDCAPVTHHPLQAFSKKSYQLGKLADTSFASRPSFAQPWLDVSTRASSDKLSLQVEYELPSHINTDELVRFFKDPFAYFAKHHMHLSFEQFRDAQDDVEPFEVSNLTKYQLNTAMLKYATEPTEEFDANYERLYQSGDLPEITREQNIEREVFEIVQAGFLSYLQENPEHELALTEQQYQDFSCDIELPSANINNQTVTLSTSMPANAQHQTTVRETKPVKIIQLFEFILQHAIKVAGCNKGVSSTLIYLDINATRKKYLEYLGGKLVNKPKAKIQSLALNYENGFDQAMAKGFLQAILSAYNEGMQTPSPYSINMGEKLRNVLLKSEEVSTNELIKVLNDDIANERSSNAYRDYFFPNNFSVSEQNIAVLKSIFFANVPESVELK